jgi:hypothetical protein
MLRRLMLWLWKFISNSEHRATLTFVGGIAAALASAWIYLFPHDDKKPAAPTVTIANPSGPVIAPGRDANFNGPVTFGLDEKKAGEHIDA